MNLRRLAFMALLTAVATLLSPLISIPAAGAKAFPVQHAVNVICGVLLGPGPAVTVAFAVALLRNLLGTGTPLAFPGGMVGAFLAGHFYKMTGKTLAAGIGEVIGTGLIGATLAYPVAKVLLGKSVAAFTYVVPFSLSSLAGAVAGVVVVQPLLRKGIARDL
jgi:energy coupling factor transporter S component ThiW